MDPHSAFQEYCDAVLTDLRTTLINVTHPGLVADDEPYNAWNGFEFVDVARLQDSVLVAFRWFETGDRTFVYTADLASLSANNYPVDFITTLVINHILERLGRGWYSQAPMVSARGFSYIL